MLFKFARPLLIDDEGCSYAQLDALVNETMRLLAPEVQAGDRVALWMPNSFAWVASFLALNALGAVSVPVNTRLTGNELRTIVHDAGARTG